MRVVRTLLTCVLATAVVVGATTMPAAAASAGTADTNATDTNAGRERLRRHLEELTRAAAVGAQVRVTDDSGTWRARSGTARGGGTAPVPWEGRFRAGSITKMFTAVTLLQLAGEGRVPLDDPLARYLPRGLVPDAGRITVRMVLQHTSGLHDLARDLPQGEEFVRTRFRHYDKAPLVRQAAAKPADFPPGTDYAYSNTNYVIAGLLIERITGRSYAEEVRRRVIEPLNLRHTSVPGDSATLPGPHAHGYSQVKGSGTERDGSRDRQPATRRHVDITKLNPSFASSAGEIVSTPGDLDKLLTSLTSGKLLRQAELAEMNRTVPTGEPGTEYGLGLKQRRLSCGRTVVGHTGGIPGYATLAFTTRDRSRRMVLSANLADWPADPGIGAPLDKVLEEAICG
ncbi:MULTISPECIES: serine hydrolase domain-containing protein [unclassified Streptomyces]|uniref:serine hydrolase domain-containing protein n=1 Tax=unclassified Streptomyces TaxID=2593676 RepID=UPI002DD97973|nr:MULTISPECIES: serine hydrolase domain-containing protein [unclassified Streptomyces]WSA96003.1 beta-lactamase family protein [Streptomyces sp. NBC_01795]WSS11376.1 beta-lactamase family protein [Streptomyces sp. NBC_01186]WSS40082.1 beta-lactamase family protein [Streptomyces sp. NBC_01187]